MFSLKCHFSRADEQGHMDRAQCCHPRCRSQGTDQHFHPLRSSMSPVLHRVLSVPLCCDGGTLESCFVFPFLLFYLDYTWFFPVTVPTLQGEGSRVLMVPWRVLVETLAPVSISPTPQLGHLNLFSILTKNFSICQVSASLYKELKGRV